MSYDDVPLLSTSIGIVPEKDDHRHSVSSAADAWTQTIPETLGRDLISTSCCWTLVRSMLRFLSPPLPSTITTKRAHTETREMSDNHIWLASGTTRKGSSNCMKEIYPDAMISDTDHSSQTSPAPFTQFNHGPASVTRSCIISPRVQNSCPQRQ